MPIKLPWKEMFKTYPKLSATIVAALALVHNPFNVNGGAL